MADEDTGRPARERILAAAEELFARDGFSATPTSRIAELAGVPKGLVHYYFKRKPDLLAALVERLPDEHLPVAATLVPGDLDASLCRLVDRLDATLDSSAVLSHLLWREADTHPDVLAALQDRYERFVVGIRGVMAAALARKDGNGDRARGDLSDDLDSAARLLASAVSYRHSVARHDGPELGEFRREVGFLADALSRKHSN